MSYGIIPLTKYEKKIYIPRFRRFQVTGAEKGKKRTIQQLYLQLLLKNNKLMFISIKNNSTKNCFYFKVCMQGP